MYGVVLPYLAFNLAKAIFRRPFQRLMQLFEDNPETRQVDSYEKEEATTAQKLMQETADRIQRSEAQKHGLLILKAEYGQMESSASANVYPVAGDRLIDVTTVLQAMVHDSTLRVHSVKSQLPGFYDPCPGEPKMLRVQYSFRSHEHCVTVPDELALMIPLAEHRVSPVVRNNNHAL
uniref:DUF3395 domain-containing protein n=1 Tax=Steinernema glaseri TaxID=37863 RepID=A0A1I7ZVT9_9BILA